MAYSYYSLAGNSNNAASPIAAVEYDALSISHDFLKRHEFLKRTRSHNG
jgi:hypothetical protein